MTLLARSLAQDRVWARLAFKESRLQTSASCLPFDRDCGLERPRRTLLGAPCGKRRGRSSPPRAHATSKMHSSAQPSLSSQISYRTDRVNGMVNLGVNRTGEVPFTLFH